MTRKKAIEIVVANVKMGWMRKKWKHAVIGSGSLVFCYGNTAGNYSAPLQTYKGSWITPSKWLEEKGHL